MVKVRESCYFETALLNLVWYAGDTNNNMLSNMRSCGSEKGEAGVNGLMMWTKERKGKEFPKYAHSG